MLFRVGERRHHVAQFRPLVVGEVPWQLIRIEIVVAAVPRLAEELVRCAEASSETRADPLQKEVPQERRTAFALPEEKILDETLGQNRLKLAGEAPFQERGPLEAAGACSVIGAGGVAAVYNGRVMLLMLLRNEKERPVLRRR